ncbi:MAG: CBS domain-containing protein [Pseudomonadales bacterium]|jgi:predicted transcriptional regulator
MLKSVKAQDYMCQSLITFSPETDLFIAIDTLINERITGAPVINSEGDLIGLMTEIECLKAILNLTYNEGEMGGTVGEYMTEETYTIAHNADIIKVAEEFINNRRRRLPVVREGKLVGQISRRDVLRAVQAFSKDHFKTHKYA